ncbi:MAG: hypothetical protein ABMB14_20415 [Myxococcota bacterium]
MVGWWGIVAACHKATELPAEPPPVPIPAALIEGAPAAATATPGAVDDGALLRLLSQRDGPPDCAAVEATVPEPVPALLDVVAHVSMPPTAPMSAARCLVLGHAVEVADAIDGWMAGAETRGLAVLVAQNIDAVPLEPAIRFATTGAAGPHAEALTAPLAASARPEIRAVVGR